MKNRKKIKQAGLFLLLFTYNLFLFPLKSFSADAEEVSFVWPSGPSVYSDAAIVMEAGSGLILYEKDIYSAYYPASITKVLTALLALENCNLNETVTMSHAAEWNVDFNSSRIGLVEGEQLSLGDALYAVMLESANEVSYAVGEHTANGPIEEFSAMMNQRVKELGGVNSNFTNPHGLHDNNHYTCAYDMALIGRAAINIPEFHAITGTRTHIIPPTNKNVARPLANHHRYIRKTLNYDGAIGGKTGGTEEAKTTLITFAQRNGLLLIAVVLHTDTALHAYEDTAAILNFGFENYTSYSIEQIELDDGLKFPSLFEQAPRFLKETNPLIQVRKNSNVVLPKTASLIDIKKSVTLTPVEEFVHGDNIIGQISYTFHNKYVGFADIVYYNKDFPVTRAEFEARWPAYLIPPDGALTDTIPDVSTEIMGDDSSPETKVPLKLRFIPLISGIAVTILIFLTGLYIIYIEIPYRKRRRSYKVHRKERMESIHSDQDII